jgi:hypothetical protein
VSAIPSEVHLGIGLVLTAPLLYAAASKLLNPAPFTKALPLFSIPFLTPGRLSARTVGAAELAAGVTAVALPVPITSASACALYAVFGVVLMRARRMGASGDCGCFGALPAGINGQAIARNVVLAAGSLGLTYLRSAGLVGAYDLGSAMVLVIVLILASATTDTLLEIRQGAG